MQHSKGHITVSRFITPINVFKLGRAKKSIAVYINLIWRQTATIQPLKSWLKYQTRKYISYTQQYLKVNDLTMTIRLKHFNTHIYPPAIMLHAPGKVLLRVRLTDVLKEIIL